MFGNIYELGVGTWPDGPKQAEGKTDIKWFRKKYYLCHQLWLRKQIAQLLLAGSYTTKEPRLLNKASTVDYKVKTWKNWVLNDTLEPESTNPEVQISQHISFLFKLV